MYPSKNSKGTVATAEQKGPQAAVQKKVSPPLSLSLSCHCLCAGCPPGRCFLEWRGGGHFRRMQRVSARARMGPTCAGPTRTASSPSQLRPPSALSTRGGVGDMVSAGGNAEASPGKHAALRREAVAAAGSTPRGVTQGQTSERNVGAGTAGRTLGTRGGIICRPCGLALTRRGRCPW